MRYIYTDALDVCKDKTVFCNGNACKDNAYTGVHCTFDKSSKIQKEKKMQKVES